mmetsp:Transcript_5642/g.23922  ORF Transcript_5642/g.23922 Transcript_5642/m.23922 type:complete len:288 (+) Transcript_5642:674-1537(+)
MLQDGPRGRGGPHGRAGPRTRRTPEPRGVLRERRRESVARAAARDPLFLGPVAAGNDRRHGHGRREASVAGARRRRRRDVRSRPIGPVAFPFGFLLAHRRQFRRRLRRDVLRAPNQGRRAVQSPRVDRVDRVDGEIVIDDVLGAVVARDGARTERRVPRRVARGLPRSGPAARRGRVPRAAHLGPAPLLLLPRLPGLEPARAVAVRAHGALPVVAARRAVPPRTERRASGPVRQGAERASPGGRGAACARAHLAFPPERLRGVRARLDRLRRPPAYGLTRVCSVYGV